MSWWTDAVLLCVFSIALIIYCNYFKDKTLHFGLCVAWLGVNIVLSATFIVYKSNLLASSFVTEYSMFFSVLIGLLRCASFILFFCIIFSFYKRKEREETSSEEFKK